VLIFLFSVMLAGCSGASSYHSPANSNQSSSSSSQTGQSSGSQSGGSSQPGGSGSGTGSGSGGGQTGSATLSGLSVLPTTATLAPGASVSLTATGTYSDGSTQNLTSSVTWSSSNTSDVSVSPAGVATGLTSGSATISASTGSFTAAATITVSIAAATLKSIEVSPANSTLPVNTTQQFSAVGSYSDGSSRDLTAQVSWSSSTIGSATVSTSGLVTGVGGGSATITATLNSVSGSTSVTVSAPTITAISVAPGDVTLPLAVSEQYTASAIYSDGSVQDLVSGVTWSSSSATVASVDSNGLATTLSAGTATITATVGSFTDSSTITVVPASLVSITVAPASVSLAAGTQQQFTATGSFSDGSTQVLTSATWSSSTASVMTVDANGLGQALAAGSSTITVTSGSMSGTAAVTVTGATLVSMTIAPLNSTMPEGATKQFTATGTFSDSSTEDLTATALWSSTDASVATIDNTGLAASGVTGTTTITASVGAISASTTLTVSSVDLISITVLPANPTVETHTSVKFTAIGNYSDGSTAPLTSVSWRSSKNNLANMHGSSGILRAKKAGNLTVTASASGVTGTTSVTISNGTLVSIAITPAGATVSAGSTQQFAAIGTFSDGSTEDVSINSHWSSSTPSVATIANAPVNAGLATTYAVGTTTIGVNHNGITATGATLTVH
jgi:trimeric autotransporter adhesin